MWLKIVYTRIKYTNEQRTIDSILLLILNYLGNLPAARVEISRFYLLGLF